MIGLILLVVAVVGLIFFFNNYQNKYQSLQGGIFNFIIVVTLAFLVLSVSYVYLSNDVSLNSFENVVDFGGVYFSWLGGLFDNFKSITGYAIDQDWSANVTESGE